MDDVPHDIRAADYADQARSLTARGGAFYHYAQAMGNVSDSSGHRSRLRAHLDCYPFWVNPDLTIQFEHWEHALPPHIAAASAAESEGLASSASRGSDGGGVFSTTAPVALRWEVAPDKVSDELLAIAEPKSRPDLIHTYALTTESLHGAAYGHDMGARDILAVLEKYSKTWPLPESVVSFVEQCSARHCRAKLLLKQSNHFVVADERVLRTLLNGSETIRCARKPDRFSNAGSLQEVEVMELQGERDYATLKKQQLQEQQAALAAGGNGDGSSSSALGSTSSTCAWDPPSSPLLRIEAKDAAAELKEKEEQEAGERQRAEALRVQQEESRHKHQLSMQASYQKKRLVSQLQLQGGGNGGADGGSNSLSSSSSLSSSAAPPAVLSSSSSSHSVTILTVDTHKGGEFGGGSGGKRARKESVKIQASEAAAFQAAVSSLSSAASSSFTGGGGAAALVGGCSGGGGGGAGGVIRKMHQFPIRADGRFVEGVRREAWEAGFPLLEEYDFGHDTRNKTILKLGHKRSDPEAMQYGLRPHVRVRDYQEKALMGMFGARGKNKARSGIIVLPCGAGKTLVGISACVRIGRSAIILCNNTQAVEQWRRAFIEFTDIPVTDLERGIKGRLKVFHAKEKPLDLPEPCVLITSYTILAERKQVEGMGHGDQALATAHVLAQIRGTPERPREWGIMVLDEVHMAPARNFRTVMDLCKAQCKLGLTATLVREDEKIGDLSYLIGPKLHEANWTDLAAQGYLATVQCNEVWCSMVGGSMQELLRRRGVPRAWESGQKLVSIMNPNKYRAAEFLLRYHEARGDKVLLFSDTIHSLKTYCELLGMPNLHGATDNKEREALLGCFRGDDEHVFKNFVRKKRADYKWCDVVRGVDLNDSQNKKLFQEFSGLSDELRRRHQFFSLGLSSVGDVAIDLPDANVLIQVSGHGGGRRQEAQRMGRILRPKSAAAAAASAAAAAHAASTAAEGGGFGGGAEGGQLGSRLLAKGRRGGGVGGSSSFNDAQFYTLISRDSHEMVTGTKRQEYLVDQGYTYRVLLEEELTQGWESPTVPKDSEKEAQLLADVVLAIDEGRGGVDKRAGLAGRGGRGGGRGGRGGGRGGWFSSSSSSGGVVASKYTQPGRYALMKYKQKKAKATKNNT